MSERRVVITGLGAVCCLGQDLKTVWDGVLQGRSGIGPITLFDTTDYDVHFAGECTDFDPEQWVNKRGVRRLDRFTLFAIAAGDMAIQDSGIDMAAVDRSRFGCIIGSGVGGLGEIEAQHAVVMEKGPSRGSPFLVPKMMINAAPGQVSIRHGLRGPNLAVATACASAAHAMGDALNVVRRGLSDIMVTGGAEAAITTLGLSGFSNMKALSKKNEDPQRASRPFDRDRDGFVLGEGAGILVIEELEHAKARGARIYAELAGFGMSGDGSHITAPDPEGAGMASAMSTAIEDAGLIPDDIDYVNAHGTSTPLNDAVETKAIKHVFGDQARNLAVSSTKSQIGHLLGASGGVEAVVVSLGILNQVAPPTINYETPDPELDLDYVPNEPREMKINAVISNSFGFGGHNGTVVFKRFD